MPRNLTFHTFAEKMPEHGQEILHFETSSFYSSIQPRFAEVEYTWVECDEYGPTGLQIYYDPQDSETPENCRVEVTLRHGHTFIEKDFWCPATDVDNLVDSSTEEGAPPQVRVPEQVAGVDFRGDAPVEHAPTILIR